jgi:hypothetical protein
MAIAIRKPHRTHPAARPTVRHVAARMRPLSLALVSLATLPLARTWEALGAALPASAATAAPPQKPAPGHEHLGASAPAESGTTGGASSRWRRLRHWLTPRRTSINVAWHYSQRWIRIPEVQVGLVATILSIAAFAYYSHAGLLFVYGDAVSHLMIARRVLDSRTPGIAQLGTNWLPLNHVMILPLVWITTLFRDGFAGGFPSMVSYVVAGVFMYRLAYEVTGSRLASYVAAAVLLLNPSLLYMQTIAMTESDLIGFTVILVYYFVRWSKTENLGDLILCAAACLAATLIRYDGWALTATAAVCVLIIAWRRHGWVRARAVALLYGLLAFAGCAGWFIYNQMVYGSGLAFFNGSFSTVKQQRTIEAGGGLPTHHNMLLSLHVYTQAVADNLTPTVFFLAMVGLVLLVLRKQGALMLVLLAPFVFNWFMLYMGVTVLYTPEIPFNGSASIFNVRYGLEMLPMAALCLGSVFKTGSEVRWDRYAKVVLGIACVAVLLVVVGQQTLSLSSYSLVDGLHGVSAVGEGATSTGAYIHDHYHGGTILVNSAVLAPAIFFANLPDHDYIIDSEGAMFRYALAHPTTVEWIVDDRNPANDDPVLHHLTRGWQQSFALRATIGGALIYQRIGG